MNFKPTYLQLEKVVLLRASRFTLQTLYASVEAAILLPSMKKLDVRRQSPHSERPKMIIL